MSVAQPSDPYWSAVLSFLDERADLLAATAAPNGLKAFRPALIGFSDIRDLHAVRQIVCHKGLIDEIPVSLLAASFGRAKAVFSNEVFVVLALGDSDVDHVRSFEIDLATRLSDPALDIGRALPNRPADDRPLLRRPARWRPRGSAPRVVAALQSPTLLNAWASSRNWRLEVAELGDHDGLSQAALLDLPAWDGDARDVAAVLVTTPLQLEQAGRLFPDAAHVWILHNGRPGLLPPKLAGEVDGILTLSRKVLALQHTHHPALMRIPSWVIAPSYEPRDRFGWTERRAWTMKSRPGTRDPYDLALTDQIIALAADRSVDIVLYGQDAPGGFLHGEARETLIRACSCYVSPLPPWAGFGLAQHECMAAGVPVAGLMWGDLREDLARDHPGLTANLDDLADVVVRLSTDEPFARSVSQAGLDYIARRRTRARMDRAVAGFVEEVARIRPGP